MARPPKPEHLRMSVPLRVMLTAEQKALIDEAARLDAAETSAWVRPILIQAAEARVKRAKRPRKK